MIREPSINNTPKVINGIIGGVGPMAGVKLHEKIIQFTPTNGTDQSHLCVHHISQSQYIPDRTTFLLSNMTLSNPNDTTVIEERKNGIEEKNEINERKQKRKFDELYNNTTIESNESVISMEKNNDINNKDDVIISNNESLLINPAYGALKAVKSLINSTNTNHKLLIGVPCNTFHSSKIWNVFENGIHEYIEENKQTTQQVKKLKVHVLHMIKETVQYIYRTLNHRMMMMSFPMDLPVITATTRKMGKGEEQPIDLTVTTATTTTRKMEEQPIQMKTFKIGLLSTQGTRDTKIYHEAFQQMHCNIDTASPFPFKCELVCLPQLLQDKMTNLIYNKQFGIKAKSSPTVDPRVVTDMNDCIEYFIKNHNCEIIILGCTELPLAIPATNSYKGIDGKTIYEHGDIQLIDPVEILAKSYVRESIRHREMENEILQRAVSIESKQ